MTEENSNAKALTVETMKDFMHAKASDGEIRVLARGGTEWAVVNARWHDDLVSGVKRLVLEIEPPGLT